MKPFLIAIGGPTGVGESSVTKGLLKKIPKTKRLITTTSRAPRLSEQDGVDYFFISEEEFKQRIEKGFFLEYTFIKERGVYYGSEKKRIDDLLQQGFNVIANIDVIGVQAMKAAYGEQCVTVFIVPETFADLENRLRKREPNMADSELQKRLKHAKNELQDKAEYDFVVINKEGQLDEAVAEVEKIIQGTP